MLARIVLVISLFTTIVLPAASQVSIIPEPVSLKQNEGIYDFKSRIVIGGEVTNEAVKKIAESLKEKLSVTGLPVTIAAANEKADVNLSLNKAANAALGKEGYQLTTSATNGGGTYPWSMES